ncbi:glutamate carboxypeptidase II [Anopheles sinensis]|uniref:Glutamate carboxypeptidase II n=1 Tax=Anopheles sinensis TaxID=74873 RepID=A0A084WTZ0_ANOSI|nr:glutamate carboxypeptidase II [Anopheles sinensis]
MLPARQNSDAVNEINPIRFPGFERRLSMEENGAGTPASKKSRPPVQYCVE